MTVPFAALPFRRLRFALLLPLALVGCDQSGTKSADRDSAPLAKVAPPAGKAWTDVIAVSAEGGYVMGNPQAPIRLVEYVSLTCSHCADFAAQSSAELKGTYVDSGRVSYEMRNFIRDAIDLTAVQLTRCGPPETYFAQTDKVLANQKDFFDKAQTAGKAAQDAAFAAEPAKRGPAIGALTGLTAFFAANGLAQDRANQCLADTAKAETLVALINKQSDAFEIAGTPTFLVNGKKVEGNTWAAIKPLLEKAGAR